MIHAREKQGYSQEFFEAGISISRKTFSAAVLNLIFRPEFLHGNLWEKHLKRVWLTAIGGIKCQN